MIYFLCTSENMEPIRLYLGARGAAMKSMIVPRTYDQLLERGDRLRKGAYIFADLELLPLEKRQQLARVWHRLEAAGCRLLNHPIESLRRYGLLRMLHRFGINDFDVYRATGDEAPKRFPVFLRFADDHEGSRTGLLHTPAELEAGKKEMVAAGHDLSKMIVTEYVETKNPRGIYVKYGAFCIGRHILPRHVFFHDEWVVKEWKLMSDRRLARELKYVHENPHEHQLRAIFAAARINYGRIDYSMVGGRMQVWEINTNPIIVQTGRKAPFTREPVHQALVRRLPQVWQDLNEGFPVGRGRGAAVDQGSV